MRTKVTLPVHLPLAGGFAALALLLFAPETVQAQELFACYVPSSGVVYRIKEPGLRDECTGKKHVEFSWAKLAVANGTVNIEGGLDVAGGVHVDGKLTLGNTITIDDATNSITSTSGTISFDDENLVTNGSVTATAFVGDGSGLTNLSSGVSDHGLLSGLADDDHTQYVLADGVRDATDGFAVTGTFGSGTIPTSGPGQRIMWYPGKAAFRVGSIFSDQWDDANIGVVSFAMGNSTIASGSNSTAMGFLTTASGVQSTAMGVGTTASGSRTTAMGNLASTNGHTGSFVYGDKSTTASTVIVTADNSFVVRAQRVFFGKQGNQVATANRYIETSTGAFLSDAGTWTNVSDRSRKENFRDEHGETVLARIAELPIQGWNYKAEDPSVRHLGPTAQDFHAAFGLGDSDKHIATVDIDGVNLLAIQALEARTRDLDDVRAELDETRQRLAALETALARLEAVTEVNQR